MENDYINDVLLGKISREQNVKISQIRAVLQLIEGGATVPFIARYRKEVTGGLDEEQIRAIYTEWDYGQKLAQRKEDVMRLIEEKGKLTPELKEAIIKATKLAEIEELVAEEMQYAVRLSAPLDVAYGFGSNWMEIK